MRQDGARTPGRIPIKRTALSLACGVVVGAVTLGGVSYAATGGSVLLGRSNASGAQTVLTNSGTGPVLALSTKAGQAPIAASATSGKATNLNADKLDGLDSTQLALRTGQTGTTSGAGVLMDLDEDGVNDTIGAFASCPAGTLVTGGGYEVYTAAGALISSRDGNGWFVVTAMAADSVADDLVAYAQCYNPRGAVPGNADPGAALRADRTASHLTAAQRAAVLRHLG